MVSLQLSTACKQHASLPHKGPGLGVESFWSAQSKSTLCTCRLTSMRSQVVSMTELSCGHTRRAHHDWGAPVSCWQSDPSEVGLQVCAETKVGSHMIRGISGGQKKRLTTGKLRRASPRPLPRLLHISGLMCHLPTPVQLVSKARPQAALPGRPVPDLSSSSAAAACRRDSCRPHQDAAHGRDHDR